MSLRRTHTLLAASALAVAVAAATALPAVAADGPETTTDGGKTVLKLVEHENEGGQYIPKGGEPQDFPEEEDFLPKVGDAFTFTSDLLQDGAEVGSNSGKCTVVAVEKFTERCVVTFTFADGTFVAEGTIAFPEEEGEPDPFTVALASGTGAYTGIKGTLTVAEHEDDNDLTAVYTTGGDQVSEVPAGGAATGGGFDDSADTALLLGLAGLAAVAGLSAMAGGRALATPRRRV